MTQGREQPVETHRETGAVEAASASAEEAHWLRRLDPADWMRASLTEYDALLAALSARQNRRIVTGARRAAGMAINALLVAGRLPTQGPSGTPEDGPFGRTYVEHLQALSRWETAPGEVRAAAAALCDAPVNAPTLVGLGTSLANMQTGPVRAARDLMTWAAEQID